MESNNINKISINIPNYSGSLEILLDLAKSQKVDLAEISITKLADQFFGKFNEILSHGNDSQRNDEIVVDNSEGFSPKVWISTLAILSILSIVLWYFLGQI